MTSKNTNLDDIAPEIIYNIFSFLSYPDVYRLRSVCRKFQVMGEFHIYQQIKSLGQTVSIKLDGNTGSKTNNNTILELEAAHYDTKNRIIEFKPTLKSKLSLANTSTQQWSAYYRLLKIHFSGWFLNSIQIPCSFQNLPPQDQAMALYHYQYNSSIEKTYELPSWHSNSSSDRYLGDKGFILSMAYQQPEGHIEFDQQQPPVTSLPTSYYSYRSIASSSPVPSAPIMEVKWVRVTLDWVLTGMMKSNIPQSQIYGETFNTLNQSLAKEGCIKYDPLSEPVLEYIISQQQQEEETGELPESLLKYVHSHTHECHTRLSRLQHMLEGAGVDAQVIWKYTFAKSYVVGNGCLLSEEDVVRRIQDSEEEWRKKKLSLTRRLFMKNRRSIISTV
ncbi:unnamed protein product [Mucor hiemalis]